MQDDRKKALSLKLLGDLYNGLSPIGKNKLVRALIDQLPSENENTERVLRQMLRANS